MPFSTPHGMWFEEFVVGEKATSPTRTITEADIVMFAGLSGDYNEIHTSAEFSKDKGKNMFGQRIAHGLLGLSIASGLAFQMSFLLGTVDVFRSIEWEFTGAIFIGDTVHVEAEVTETKAVPRLGNGKVSFKVTLKKQDGTVAQRGTWTLLVKGRPKAE